MTPSGIEPATFWFGARHLNHCATAVAFYLSTLKIGLQLSELQISAEWIECIGDSCLWYKWWHHPNRCQVWKHGCTFLTCYFIPYIDTYKQVEWKSVETEGCHVVCAWLHVHAWFQHGDVGAGQVLLKTVNEFLLEACLKLHGLKFPQQLF